ncbi:MAG: hypothetical protein K0Q93_3305 [Nocardioidaceae bacterium]|nr:hypothetical protein [Nocardioidaceae bacterium]
MTVLPETLRPAEPMARGTGGLPGRLATDVRTRPNARRTGRRHPRGCARRLTLITKASLIAAYRRRPEHPDLPM